MPEKRPGQRRKARRHTTSLVPPSSPWVGPAHCRSWPATHVSSRSAEISMRPVGAWNAGCLILEKACRDGAREAGFSAASSRWGEILTRGRRGIRSGSGSGACRKALLLLEACRSTGFCGACWNRSASKASRDVRDGCQFSENSGQRRKIRNRPVHDSRRDLETDSSFKILSKAHARPHACP